MNDAFVIAIDWGTSNLRLWVLDSAGKCLHHAKSDKGMSRLSPSDYQGVIEGMLQEAGGFDDVPVLICGMAGAATGWQEAPYIDVPAKLDALGAGAVKVDAGRGDVRIVPGLAQRDIANPDVMRGEETLLYGAKQLFSLQDAFICLPGTHAKWVEMQKGQVVRFATHMTGELYSLLKSHSILSPVLEGNSGTDADFIDGIEAGYNAPEALVKALFSIRAGALLFGKSSPASQRYLSGLLIGAELAEAAADKPIYLMAAGEIAHSYEMALRHLGREFYLIDAEEAVKAALFHMAKSIWGR